MMDQKQLEHRALQVRWQYHGTYRGKSLCQACLLEKANISAPEDKMVFDEVWHQWGRLLKRDRCVVCGEQKETITLPVT